MKSIRPYAKNRVEIERRNRVEIDLKYIFE
nr:MAG TPA: hypothetical protein [Caudoviricetes sp.]